MSIGAVGVLIVFAAIGAAAALIGDCMINVGRSVPAEIDDESDHLN